MHTPWAPGVLGADTHWPPQAPPRLSRTRRALDAVEFWAQGLQVPPAETDGVELSARRGGPDRNARPGLRGKGHGWVSPAPVPTWTQFPPVEPDQGRTPQGFLADRVQKGPPPKGRAPPRLEGARRGDCPYLGHGERWLLSGCCCDQWPLTQWLSRPPAPFILSWFPRSHSQMSLRGRPWAPGITGSRLCSS